VLRVDTILKSLLLFIGIGLSQLSHAQIDVVIQTTDNNKCIPDSCGYSGPDILINEMMTTPAFGNGSLIGRWGGEAEWIELYNPNPCKSVDISCYFLGNNIEDNFQFYGGGYYIPQGTIVPPNGFALVRGRYAIPLDDSFYLENGGRCFPLEINRESDYCYDEGYRFWLPDEGGWLALYDEKGDPVDAVSWGNLTSGFTNKMPCSPNSASCNTGQFYVPYTYIDSSKKEYLRSGYSEYDLSYRRIPDGGPWVLNSQAKPTMGYQNGGLTDTVSICNGSVKIIPKGGAEPYSIEWVEPSYFIGFENQYLCPGDYLAKVRDAIGDTLMVSFTIKDYKPEAIFNPSKTAFCEGDKAFQLDNYSFDSCFNCQQWFSGTGVNSIYFYPEKLKSGEYPVVYNIKDAGGCFNSDTANMIINPKPEALFSNQDSAQCLKGNSFSFFNHSRKIEDSLKYVWDFGDKTQDTLENPSHEFRQAGNYQVSLLVENKYHCLDTFTKKLVVYPGPEISIDLKDEWQCFPDNNFQFSARGIFDNKCQFLWEFGDLGKSSDPSPTHHYNLEGKFFVSCIVSDSNNCKDTTTTYVNVLHTPDTGFVISLDTCSKTVVCLSPDEDSINYSWMVFEKTVGSENSLTYRFPSEGNYTLSLIADNKNKCFSETKKIVKIPSFENSVFVPNAFTPNNDGINDVFKVVYETLCLELQLQIYDRWGKLVYTSEENGLLEWNGTDNNGQLVPTGAYYFSVRSREFSKYGTVTVIR
jgi:gliding motility-associated-like protein